MPSDAGHFISLHDAEISHKSKLIHGKCSIISARCLANVKQEGLEKSWKDICRMRDMCDKAVSSKNCFEFVC